MPSSSLFSSTYLLFAVIAIILLGTFVALSADSQISNDSSPPPTGRQFRIHCGNASAVITEVGATLREYKVGDRDVVHPFPVTSMSDSHGQVLIPFPNRTADGKYQFEGSQHQLPINSVHDNSAKDGLVNFLPWRVRDHQPSELRMEIDHFPSPGYPFSFRAAVKYSLQEDGLHVRYSVRNTGTQNLPLGVGCHPYFTVNSPTIDSNHLTVPANKRLTTNSGHTPIGTADVQGTPFDFRQSRPIGDLKLDTTFTDFIRDGSGNAFVELQSEDRAQKVRIRIGPECNYVQMYSSDTLHDVSIRRRSLAVEPYSCPPNAFNSKESLQTVVPNSSYTFTWSVLPQ